VEEQGHVWVVQHLREMEKEAKRKKKDLRKHKSCLPRSCTDSFRPVLSTGSARNEPGWQLLPGVMAGPGRAVCWGAQDSCLICKRWG